MTFLTVKLNSKDLEDCIRELESLEVPQYVTLHIYKEVNPRVSEVSVDVSHVPLMMSLRMSWDEFYEIRRELERRVKSLEPKILEVFAKYKGRLRDYSVITSYSDKPKWIQLGVGN